MKNFAPYLILLILAGFYLNLRIKYQKVQHEHFFYSLEDRARIFSDSLRGSVVQDTPLMDGKEDMTSLYDVIGDRTTALVISSTFSCSTCREDELDQWNTFKENNKDLPAVFIASEARPLDDETMVKVKSFMNSFEFRLGAYVDIEGQILAEFGINPVDTPVIFIINPRSKEIIAANRPMDQTREKDLRFIQYFEVLSK